MLKILSWNVNGIRACLKKGLIDWFHKASPDILGLQEIKSRPDQIEKEYEEILHPASYDAFWNPAERAGYSGTALFTRIKPVFTKMGFENPKFEGEGRVIYLKINNCKPAFNLFNIYFPNGQMSDERLQYKLDFYNAFLDYADQLKEKGENIIVMGDFNTVHREIDLKNPKENEKYSGFLPIERAWIDKFISHGYVDTFRTFHPDSIEYSWWTYRFNARNKNIGWRIDYFFVNEKLLPFVKESFILKDVTGSDHCPIGILLEC